MSFSLLDNATNGVYPTPYIVIYLRNGTHFDIWWTIRYPIYPDSLSVMLSVWRGAHKFVFVFLCVYIHPRTDGSIGFMCFDPCPYVQRINCVVLVWVCTRRVVGFPSQELVWSSTRSWTGGGFCGFLGALQQWTRWELVSRVQSLTPKRLFRYSLENHLCLSVTVFAYISWKNHARCFGCIMQPELRGW